MKTILKNHMILIFVLSCLLMILHPTVQAQTDINEGIKLFKENKLDEAKTFFESYTKSNTKNPSGFFYLGRIYFNQGDNDKAVESLKQAIQINTSKPDYHLWLGHAYARKAQKAGIFSKIKLARKSKSAFKKAVEIDPSSVRAREGLMGYLLNAPGIAGGSTKKAIEQAEKIKKLDKIRGHMAFISIYNNEEKYDLAEKEILAAIKIDSENTEFKYELGYNYIDQEKYEQAFANFESMIVVNSQDMNAYYQVGRTAAISGQNLDRAVKCLRFYLNHDQEEGSPSHDSAHWRLGMVYEHKQDFGAAESEYEKALKINPENKLARDALKRLR